MPRITFQPDHRTVEVAPGTPLPEAARRAGVEIQMPCGGKGTCGKCIVKIDGPVQTDSLGALSRTAVAEGYALACRTTVLDADLTVELPESIGQAGGQFTSAREDQLLVQRDLFPREWQFDPIVLKWVLLVAAPKAEDGLSDLDRINRALIHDWGTRRFLWPLSVIRRIPDIVRARGGQMTVTLVREQEYYHVVDIEAGDTATQQYGVCVDVGTTTVAVQLIYLPLAKPLTAATEYNGQIPCGLDVISRIHYARTPEKLEELRTRVLKTINTLIEQLCAENGLRPETISEAVISGNTVMTHLLLGLKPDHIRLAPYTPAILQTPWLPAGDLGVHINPESRIYLSPCVGSYVGGDITSGLLCTDLAADCEEVCLFIDIGTNGELVIGNRDFLMTCACSAGPAFEGGGLAHGMRAARGAIERVEIDPATAQAACWTIGNVRPKGICGSGIITLIAHLFLTGWLDAAGKLRRDRPSPFIRIEGRQAWYTIVPAEDSGLDGPIRIGELDIENILRAKAAIYSACALLVKQVGLRFDDIARVYIAGGFGRYLDLEVAKVIGLIPDLPRERFHYIGNASLTGSYMVLVSQEFQRKQEELARRMTYIELSTDPTYMEQYTAALFLPHTDPTLFPSVTAR